ncbi:MAG: hypothetical protein AAGJ40_09410 [Planctomycetota bacterium]
MSPESFAAFARSLVNDLGSDPLDDEIDEAGARVRDVVRENFEEEIDGDGNVWEPRKRDYLHDPLRETFAMFGAATVRGAPGSVEVKSRSELILGVSADEIEYAHDQNFGNPDKNLPAREYMHVRDDKVDRLEEPLAGGVRRVVDDGVRRNQA